MDDTHTFGPTGNEPPPEGEEQDAIDELAALDPADAPGAAERYAGELAAELEAAGAAAPDPVQLQADLDDKADPGVDQR